MSEDNVPVSALLGAAYEAVVHGQGLAAREAVDLVRELGFEKDGTAKPFRFAYQRTEVTDAGPQVRTVHATVPLLSLINPPVISIDQAEISMSLHLTSQAIETTPADTATANRGSPAVEQTTPRLKGRIVHKNDNNAVLTIASTLKQRDLLGSSRLTQLLDAAVSDRDSVWYQVLERAEPFREAATAFIDAVDDDGSTGNGTGVHKWLQELWQLKETVTEAVSAFRDGQPEKIPPLHERWNTRCNNLTWVDRHTEQEDMAQLRRTFLATATDVWNAFLPGAQVTEFGPPTVDQLQVRFKTARAALAAAAPNLNGLPGKLNQLEGDVAQGCTAHRYGQQEAVAATLVRYNTTAAEIRGMWILSGQSPAFRSAQDKLAEAAEAVWDALAREVPDDFRWSIEKLDAECKQLQSKLQAPGKQLDTQLHTTSLWFAREDACSAQKAALENWKLHKRGPDKQVIAHLETFNQRIGIANERIERMRPKSLSAWTTAAQAWNETARQFWGILTDTETHPVSDVVELSP
ncbi:DUF2589 domain-containing protein [Streptomyces sp. NPDC100445]|uniref:DUF2589 domain-containing protein n=1 Tax=Streptomyces sp. NPDC100445 TaxID=3366102 RepID=UPI003828D8F4